MKVIGCPKQSLQPNSDSEDELVKFDVEYLVRCLSQMRNTQYSMVGRPDTLQRNLPQPDYLVKDREGNLVAIEHARFFESQEGRQRLAHKMRRFNVLIGLINPPTPEDLGRRLAEFFDDKLAKEQFAEFGHCEKILLARSRWSDARTGRFMKADHYFNPQRRKDCDHFYLIVSQQLLEVF